VCRTATAMAKRKRKRKRKSEAIAERKTKVITVLAPIEAGHTAEATATNKDAVIKALGAGMGPGQAAAAVGVGRSTIFVWKKQDPEFSTRWDEARETAWDRLEGTLYNLGNDGDRQSILDVLKAKRPSEWRNNDNVEKPQTDFFLNITLEEQFKRLERLGLPIPVIESDYEEVPADDVGEDQDKS
jgi:hypothetical protein